MVVVRNEFPTATTQASHGRGGRRRVRALAGLFAATLIALPVALITHTSTSHAAQTQDEIIFTSSKQCGTTCVEFKSASGTISDESAGPGGGCSNPVFTVGGTPTTTPFLNVVGASYHNTGYPAGPYPSGSPSSAGIGFSTTNMGVACSGVPSEQGSQVEPSEDLIFSVGTNSVDAGRPFTRVQLALANADSKNPTSGELVESLNGTVEGTTPFTIGSGLNQLIDSGIVNTGFNQLEVRVNQNSGMTAGVSATWPSTKDPLQTTFYFPRQLPPGGSTTTQVTDPTTGKTLTETITNTGTTTKDFTDFSANFTASSRDINFSTVGTGVDSFTATFDWGDLFPGTPGTAAGGCAPGPGAPGVGQSSGIPIPAQTCGYPTFTVNGITQSVTFCSSPPPLSAPANMSWCVFDDHYVLENTNISNNTVVEGTRNTQKWYGVADTGFHH